MKLETLEKDNYYHIYNRGINGCTIFNSNENKRYFLELISKYFENKIALLGYCLMDNHFHFAIQIISDKKTASQALSNLFNAYSKAFNKEAKRTGALFERPFRRIKIKDEDYLKNLILYIHKNPENHGVVKNFADYKFTSFQEYTSQNFILSYSQSEYVISLFNDKENFILSHEQDLSGFKNLTGLRGNMVSSKIFDKNIKNKFFKYIHELQDTITSKLEAIDRKATVPRRHLETTRRWWRQNTCD